MLNLKIGSCILGAVLLFSSCVAEQSSLEMNTSLAGSPSDGLNGQNAFGGQTSANSEFVSPYPPGSPIPIKAPRGATQSATTPVLANADGTPVQQVQSFQSANAGQLNNPVAGQITQNATQQTIQAPSLVSSLAVPTPNPNRTSVQIANATAQPIASQANATSIVDPAAQPAQVAALDPGLSQEAPKSNFFTRWADAVNKQKRTSKTSSNKIDYYKRNRSDEDGIRRSLRKTKKPAKKQKLASISPNDTSVSTNAEASQASADNKSRRSSKNLNALPGVKTNNQIFGIEDHGEEDETKVAALGGLTRLSPNGLRIQHEKVQVACLKQGVLQILKKVERRYGKKPIITSGYRSPKRNRRAGGARNSQHIYCKAVDIQVEGVSKWDLAKYLRSLPERGGVGTYCRTKSVHIDIGSKRDWHSKCRRSSVKKRKKRKKS